MPVHCAQARGSTDPRFDMMHASLDFMQSLNCICLYHTATSAPVERVFSHGGLFMSPHRARLKKSVLSDLVFLKGMQLLECDCMDIGHCTN